MNSKRLIASIIEIIVGGVLLVSSFFGKVDEFWSGMGTSLLLIGVIFLVKNIKYNMDIKYREKIDIEYNDERNKYLSLKSWAWAGYIFVLCGAVATIVFKIIGKEDCMMLSSASVCFIMILYWISHMYLKRKY
ncbi:MAG: hypothetical protein IKW30_12940 [Lachnospiraceae bacterium]|nr:hypothetical protein [Lachnospiraceae bacterium]